MVAPATETPRGERARTVGAHAAESLKPVFETKCSQPEIVRIDADVAARGDVGKVSDPQTFNLA